MTKLLLSFIFALLFVGGAVTMTGCEKGALEESAEEVEDEIDDATDDR